MRSPYVMADTVRETACAGAGGASSIASAAPEHVIDIVNGEETKSAIRERILARKLANLHARRHIREAAATSKADPKSDADDEAGLPHTRYKLQKFTNGGTPYIDEEGKARTDGAESKSSGYEAWRREINDRKRKARLEQEKADLERVGRSPDRAVIDRRRQLDSQVDDFLYNWIQEQEDL
jgi:hypothetical protein